MSAREATAPAEPTVPGYAIAKLTLRPTDILVVKFDQVLTRITHNRIREHLSALRGDGGKVLVLDGGADILVVEKAGTAPGGGA